MRKSALILGLILALPPSIAAAQDGSLEKCGDLSAPATDVAHHCRRAVENGGLTGGQALAARLNLGDALLALGRPRDALAAFDAAAVIGRDRVELYMGRADAYETLGRKPEAAEDLDRALALAPGSLDVRLGRGAFFLRAGRPEAALEEFSSAVAIDDEDPDARFNLGLTYLALNRGAEAERAFSTLLRDFPNDAGAHLHRARALTGRDDRRALADFDRAAALAPDWAEPWFLSGRVLDRLGETEAANRRFRRAFELGYRDPWLLQRIRSLGG